ncbi:DUF3309 family protein [Pseudomarimonas arenosa]|uniref:DUF3309 domain-containing protein n=1 Tax=Pseudomarimonas arenosa TaxID=2774145 RepID=A0AAW3ZQQ2_9GAMM|nr:DUF3309 family protein [Pseudomarimonas arenosa]MBD8527442.1 DUF3309 domain-containing protein [Pseudomarimonas arenosa]
MSLSAIVLVVLIIMLVGSLPRWSHSRSWGYGPSGGLGVALAVVLALVVLGHF